MKLLILQETDWLKRYPAQQHHLAEMMSKRGHKVIALDFPLSWRSDGNKGLYSKRRVFNNIKKIHEDANIQVIRPSFIRLPWMDYLSIIFSHKIEMDRQFNEFQPDSVIGFGILNSFLAASALKKRGIPFIYYWIDALHLLIPVKIFQGVGKWIEKKTLKNSDWVLTINDNLRDLVLKMGAPVGKTTVLRAGIDINKFSSGLNTQPIRKQFSIEQEDIVLFFMGFLYDFSGLKEVALKIAEIRDKHLKLVIVGEGDAYSGLKQIREKYHLEDQLILTGNKSYQAIPALISISDICLLPCDPWEPIMQDIVPIKLYEYMAMQKPVICTKLPGVMREFGNDNGIVFVNNPGEVIEKAKELISNGKLKELGIKARNFAERNSWEKVTDEFEKVLQEVLAEKKK